MTKLEYALMARTCGHQFEADDCCHALSLLIVLEYLKNFYGSSRIDPRRLTLTELLLMLYFAADVLEDFHRAETCH